MKSVQCILAWALCCGPLQASQKVVREWEMGPELQLLGDQVPVALTVLRQEEDPEHPGFFKYVVVIDERSRWVNERSVLDHFLATRDCEIAKSVPLGVKLVVFFDRLNIFDSNRLPMSPEASRFLVYEPAGRAYLDFVAAYAAAQPDRDESGPSRLGRMKDFLFTQLVHPESAVREDAEKTLLQWFHDKMEFTDAEWSVMLEIGQKWNAHRRVQRQMARLGKFDKRQYILGFFDPSQDLSYEDWNIRHPVVRDLKHLDLLQDYEFLVAHLQERGLWWRLGDILERLGDGRAKATYLQAATLEKDPTYQRLTARNLIRFLPDPQVEERLFDYFAEPMGAILAQELIGGMIAKHPGILARLTQIRPDLPAETEDKKGREIKLPDVRDRLRRLREEWARKGEKRSQ